MSEPILMQITLNADAVIAPAHKAIAVCAQLVPISLQALRDADLDNPPKVDGAFIGIGLEQTVSIEDRRQFFELWLVSKAIHEIARGVRLSLEEAAQYVWAFRLHGRSMPYGDFQREQEAVYTRANGLNFPALLAEVNAGLTAPFDFSEAYTSLQKARNCLEHQDGLVLPRHLDVGQDTMTLRLPEYQIWAIDLTPPIQIVGPVVLEGESRIEIRPGLWEHTYRAGERVSFAAADLQRIAMGCFVFVQDLVAKLPR